MQKIERPEQEAGFSLLELIVAMAVTLVITGAMYGLIGGGQNAFRREPELTERQQNIRTAMDLIQRDIASAGVGMPGFIQSFSPGLNACASCPMGPDGVKTDDIEVIGNPGGVDPEPSCHYPGGNASNVRLYANNTFVRPGQIFMVFLDDGSWTIRQASNTGSNSTGAGNCDPGEPKIQINFSPGASDINVPGGICSNGAGAVGTAQYSTSCQVNSIGSGEVIGWRVRNGPDGVPNLERRTTGTLSDPANINAAENWQVVARGIEDLQVRYRTGKISTGGFDAQGWGDDPGTVACSPGGPANTNCTTVVTPCGGSGEPACFVQPTDAGYNTLVREARITLAARSEARNIQGATNSATGGSRIRGRLTQTASMRMALYTLSQRKVGASPAPYWN